MPKMKTKTKSLGLECVLPSVVAYNLMMVRAQNLGALTAEKTRHGSESTIRSIKVELVCKSANAATDDEREASTAQQWKYDPEASPAIRKPRKTTITPDKKQKASATEATQRHTWLAHPLDADRNPPDHPDYDPRTLYIPPGHKFSAFEQQYWDIKSKFMDTIVFFKKGKFYELYENDATIGHQLFDLKLTDRVNMRMVCTAKAMRTSPPDDWFDNGIERPLRT